MDQQQLIAGYEARAKMVGKTIAELCAEAGIACSTFSRWKVSEKNPEPIGVTFSSMKKVERALETFEEEARARLAKPTEHRTHGPESAVDDEPADQDAAA